MSDRPNRTYWGFWASFVQSIFALLMLLLFAAAVFIAGALNFGDAPFRTENAVQIGGILILPVAAVVTSSFLLWLRSKSGWYLTLFVNVSLESLMIYVFFHELLWRHDHPQMPSPYPDKFYALIHLLLVLPVVMLFVPDTRRDFLDYDATGSLAEETHDSEPA